MIQATVVTDVHYVTSADIIFIWFATCNGRAQPDQCQGEEAAFSTHHAFELKNKQGTRILSVKKRMKVAAAREYTV